MKLSGADDEDGSDFINANFVPGFNSKREFIVTQVWFSQFHHVWACDELSVSSMLQCTMMLEIFYFQTFLPAHSKLGNMKTNCFSLCVNVNIKSIYWKGYRLKLHFSYWVTHAFDFNFLAAVLFCS